MAGIIDTIFNPIFGWMFDIPSILAIIILATVLALISTLLQKYLTDQAKMKRLREDTKKYQEQMKKLRNEPDKLMKVQQKIMPIQMELMRESFKPLLVTLIPFLLVFLWLSNHFGYLPIEPNQPFVVTARFEEGMTGKAVLTGQNLEIENPQQDVQPGEDGGVIKWVVKGPAGTHDLQLNYAGATIERKVLITTERSYEAPEKTLRGPVRSFNVENQKLTPLGDFDIFGWRPGWIFYYIVLSIPLSLLLKKWMDVV